MKRALVLALLAVAALPCACSSSSSSAPSPSPTGTVATTPASLQGTYVPAGDPSAAQFASLAFTDSTHYSATRANCSASCASAGTYTFDGIDALLLTDGATGQVERIDFQPTKLGSDGSTPQSLALQDETLAADGGSLVSSGGSLLSRVIEGLVNGILMVLVGSPAATTAADGGSSSAPPKSDVDVRGAIAELQQQLASPPLAPYYQDGTRAEGCWANPVGSDLTDIQKAFYCSMPLEFRLCNSLVLLATKSSADVPTRWSGFVQCEQRVDSIAGGSGAFVYDAKINASYYWLMLENDSELSPADEATVAASVKPASSGRSFDTLVSTIAAGAATEAQSAAFTGLQDLLDQAESAATAAGEAIP